MKIVDKHAAAKWCEEHGIPTNERGLPAMSKQKTTIDFAIPKDAGARTALVKEHMEKALTGSSCMVWLNDWNVWPTGQWQHLFDRFRLSYGCSEHLIDKPAHIIEKGEYDAAISIVIYSVLMLWDCYVITDKGSWLFYSHDEVGYGKV
jgi:hypothetical protein